MNKPGLPRLAILGGGPVGLEAALYAKQAGCTVTLFEQGQIAESVNRWGFARMFTPFGMNSTTLGKQVLRSDRASPNLPADTEYLTGREFREVYLLPLAASSILKESIRTPATVVSIGRIGWRKTDPADPRKPLSPFRLLVREANNVERFEVADAILDCTGTYTRPNWVGDGGIPALGEIAARPQVPYWLEDIRGAKKATYSGKNVALIGSGYSAASTMCGLAELADENQSTWVIWLTSGSRTQPLIRVPNDPLKERDRLAARANQLATRGDGNLEYHALVQIDELVCHGPDKGFRISGRVGGRPMSWDVERVIANVGYRPDTNLTAELRVTEPHGDTLTDEPGYYLLGAKSFGRSSDFLLKQGHGQIREVLAVILNQNRLDLYAKAA